jgi:hypothetical protein
MKDGIFFIASPDNSAIQFLDFLSGKVRTLATLKAVPAYGMAVSPDGRWALVPEYEEHGMDLMLFVETSLDAAA